MLKRLIQPINYSVRFILSGPTWRFNQIISICVTSNQSFTAQEVLVGKNSSTTITPKGKFQEASLTQPHVLRKPNSPYPIIGTRANCLISSTPLCPSSHLSFSLSLVLFHISPSRLLSLPSYHSPPLSPSHSLTPLLVVLPPSPAPTIV